MAIPLNRYKIMPLRGSKANLDAGLSGILEGEICYAFDEDQYYQKENGVLVLVGASKAQGALADTAMQPGDNISTLSNDAGYITVSEVPDVPVTSVAGKVGDVTLVKADIGDFSDSDYATAAQGLLADTATQPGDNVSSLTNDAGYITLAEVPPDGVTSVNSQTGDVVLTAGDLGLENVDNTSDSDKPISTATQAALDTKADLVGGVIPTEQIPAIAVTEFLGDVADEAEMLALSGQKGDWCNRQDVGLSFVITGEDPSVLAGWTNLVYPAAPVTSVNGQTGTVTLGASDVSAVAVSGDNMTGNLTLGTDKIALNATDGSASFASGAAIIASTGKVEVKRNEADPNLGNNNPAFVVKNSVTNADAMWLAASYFRMGGSVASAPNIELNADGTGSFKGQVLVNRGLDNTSEAGSIVISNNQDANAIRLNNNGSSSFASRITTDASLVFKGTLNAPNTGLGEIRVGTTTGPELTTGGRAAPISLFTGNGATDILHTSFNSDGSITTAGTIGAPQAYFGTLGAQRTVLAGNDVYNIRTFDADNKWNGVLTSDGTFRLGTELSNTSSSDFDNSSNIKLDGADGSGLFAGNITSRSIQLGSASTTFPLLVGNGSTNNFTVENTGKVRIGGTLPGNPNIELNADGSSSFAGTVEVSDGTGTIELNKAGLIRANRTTTTAGLFQGQLNGVVTSSIKADGSATFSGNITAGNVSDIKFKENITDAKPQLADVAALGSSLKNWDWKEETPLNDELKSRRFLGLIAQEAEAICPGVTYEVDEGEDGYKAINHDILVMKLLGAVAELKAEIEELKKA